MCELLSRDGGSRLGDTSESVFMPKLPDMSAAAVRRRQALSEAPVKTAKTKAPAKKATAPARKRAVKRA